MTKFNIDYFDRINRHCGLSRYYGMLATNKWIETTYFLFIRRQIIELIPSDYTLGLLIKKQLNTL